MNTARDLYYCAICNEDTKFIFIWDMAVCEKCRRFAYREVKERKTETQAMVNRTHQAYEQVAKNLVNSRSASADKAKTQQDVGVEVGKASLENCPARSYVALNEPDTGSLTQKSGLFLKAK